MSRPVRRAEDHLPEEWDRYLKFKQEYLDLCRRHGFYLSSCGCCCGVAFLEDEAELNQRTEHFFE